MLGAAAGTVAWTALGCNWALSGRLRQTAAPVCAQSLPLLGYHRSLVIGLLGGLVLFAYILAGLCVLRRWRRTRRVLARLPSDQPAAACVLAASFGIHRLSVVDTSELMCLCTGLLRPRVLVSRGLLETFSTSMLSACLAHEASHVRRRDPLRQLLGQLAAAPGALLPLTKALTTHLALLAELRADEAAIHTAGRSSLLAALARFLGNPGEMARGLPLSTGIADGVQARLTHLLTGRPPRLTLRASTLALSMLAMLAVLAATWLLAVDAGLVPHGIETALHVLVLGTR